MLTLCLTIIHIVKLANLLITNVNLTHLGIDKNIYYICNEEKFTIDKWI